MTIQSGSAAAFETPSTSGSEEMSAAELAYFESGGQDTSGLEQGEGGQGSSQSGNSDPAGAQAGSEQTGASDDPDDLLDDDGEMLVTIGADGKPRDKGGKFVPHKAFHAVREKYKATRAELAETKEKFTRYDERLQTVNALLQQASQPAQPAEAAADDVRPDPEKDIFAFVAWQGRQLEKLQTQLNEKAGNFEKHTAEQQFRSSYIADASAFVQKTPDFRDAYSHLVSGRDKELEAIGMADPAARKAYIAKEERAIVEQALQNGLSPSQVLYNLSKARGFSGPAPKNDGGNNAQRIAQIAQSQKVAGNPLSNAGGTSGEGLTPDAIANMSEAEFDAAVSKLSAAQQRALFGA